jgi:putative FmdB family regulatory protein
MPTYDYRCDACGHSFEHFQSITASPLKKCPDCGKSKLRRLIGTGAAVLFKGDGFYITDYRSENYKKAAEAESGGGTKKDADAQPSTESKPSTEATPAPPPKTEPASKSRPAKTKKK